MLSTFVLPLLRGCGQMLFQPSARTGAVFLLVILWQSSFAFFMCTAGVLGATLCARRLEYPDVPYQEGEGGFNGGLLGLALAVFYEPGAWLLIVALVGGAATGLVRAALLRLLPVPPFTAPFVMVAWPAFYLCGGLLGLASLEPPLSSAWHGQALLTSASQVLFIVEPLAGAWVFLAVWLHSRAAMVWIAAASLTAWLAAVLFQLPADLAAAGLLGYNALILAAALEHRRTRSLLFVAGVVCSVLLSCWLLEAAVTPLSAPFVLSAWLVIGLETALARRSARAGGRP